MKKVSGILLALSAYASTAFPAFAQAVDVDPCPTNSNQFFKLCQLDASQIGRIINTAVVIILVIAVLVSLFYLLWGGIRWITSGGDKGKVEEARKHIVAAIIGLVIAFLAYFILTLVLGIFGLRLDALQLPTIL